MPGTWPTPDRTAVAAVSLSRYIDLTGMIERKYEELRTGKALIEDKDLTG